MGNTPASPNKAKQPTATQLDLVPFQERFEALARPSHPRWHQQEQHQYQQQQQEQHSESENVRAQAGKAERFVLFEDRPKVVGPRATQVASRLFRVLDAGGDGRLDFKEFSSAACLLEGSPVEDKLTLLFNMYGNQSKPGLIGREGITAFILDIVAASPPPFAPLGHQADAGAESSQRTRHRASRREDKLNLEFELQHALGKMAGVVLANYDADGDGFLTEQEWRAYLRREEGAVKNFLKTLSDSIGELLLP